MLKEILAITGKPGLFRILSHSGKTLIVEDLTNGKRFSVSSRDRVVSLGDIAMYTTGEDMPLSEIMDVIYVKEDGKQLDIKEIISGEGLKERFKTYIRDFDPDRVHDSDIKKLFTWYNLLVSKGFSKFTEEVKQPEKEENKEKVEEKTAKKEKK